MQVEKNLMNKKNIFSQVEIGLVAKEVKAKNMEYG